MTGSVANGTVTSGSGHDAERGAQVNLFGDREGRSPTFWKASWGVLGFASMLASASKTSQATRGAADRKGGQVRRGLPGRAGRRSVHCHRNCHRQGRTAPHFGQHQRTPSGDLARGRKLIGPDLAMGKDITHDGPKSHPRTCRTPRPVTSSPSRSLGRRADRSQRDRFRRRSPSRSMLNCILARVSEGKVGSRLTRCRGRAGR